MSDIDPKFLLPAPMWKRVRPLLPAPPSHAKGGRPHVDDRCALNAIYYVLRTGIHWNALPKSLCASSTAHRRLQEWKAAGVFETLWMESLGEFDAKVGLDWDWQSMDGAMTKAPIGGEKTGPNPTDRDKSGTKCSLIVEGHGGPTGVVIAGANVNDHKVAGETIEARLFAPPPDLWTWKQNLCLDAGYDTRQTRVIVAEHGLIAPSADAEKKTPRRNETLGSKHVAGSSSGPTLGGTSAEASSFAGPRKRRLSRGSSNLPAPRSRFNKPRYWDRL